MHRRARHLNARHAGAGLVLDARRISGLNDGDAVSTWNDVSGNGWDATGTSTARPLYKTAIQGGQPILRFDGSNDILNITATGALDYSKAVGQVYILSVAKHANAGADASQAVVVLSTNLSGFTRATLFAKQTSEGVFSGARRLDGDSFTGSVSAGTSLSFCVARCNALYAQGTLSASRNSITAATAALSGSSVSSNTRSASFSIGSSSAGFNKLAGDIGLVMVSNLTMSQSVIRRLEHSAAFSFKIQCS